MRLLRRVRLADVIVKGLPISPLHYQPEPGAPAVGRLAMAMGTAEFTLRGKTIVALAQPYRFFLLQRVQAIYESLDPSDKSSVDEMLASCGMSDLLEIKLDRRIGRSDNLEVWL